MLILVISMSVFAQSNNQNWSESVPLDPNVVQGTLPNGMRYYIRHNELPKNRADYYIVHNVGAILETPEQNGLAHFTEHMAFNGTKHFPDKALLNFMEKNGVAFGHNVNAFTGTDVTAYMITKVPTTREGLIDTSLLVLEDWSRNISFENSEIDAERGVIREEWRTRRTADFRLRKKTSEAIYNGSKYAVHDVIGELDVINNCEYETLKSFYYDWYRPNLQAIIIVGDVDVKEIEKKIIERFSKLKNPENQKERYTVEIPNNNEPLISVATDEEASRTTVQVIYKHDVVKSEDKNLGYYKLQFQNNLFSIMFNNRLSELTQKENPPYIYSYNFYQDFVRTKAGYYSVALAKPEAVGLAIETILIENKRVQQFGFLQTELDRAKADLLKQIEKQYKEKDKTKTETYIWQYFGHFLTNEPAPGAEYDYKFAKSILPAIYLEEVNKLAKIRIIDKNMVVTVTGPQKDADKIPTVKDIKIIIEKTQNVKIEAYKETISDEPLLKAIPTASKIISEKSENGVVEWKFANGATVVIKQTDFKEDEILMTAYSLGGYSLVSENDIPSAMMVGSIITQSGVGNFSMVDLSKKLAGKNVQINPYIDENDEGFSGTCSPKDFETMLQLMYLYQTQARKDKVVYGAYMQRIKAYLENKALSPNSRFSDTISVVMNDYHPRVKAFNSELLDKVDFEKIFEIYSDRFSDPNNFTYIFVGNINPSKIKPLIETYIGGLALNNREETYRDNNIRAPKNVVKKKIITDLKVEKSTVYVNYHGKYKFNSTNNLMLDAFKYILGLRYTATIREEEGGSYGVRVGVSKNHFPYSNYSVMIKFDCATDKQELLTSIVYREIEKIKNEGPTVEDLQKTKEYFKKLRGEQLQENKFWKNALLSKYYHGIDITKAENFDDILNNMTVSDLKKAANKFFKNNYVEIIMLPKTK